MTTRDEFEQWAETNGFSIIARTQSIRWGWSSDTYDSASTHTAWTAWQAAYAAGMTRAAEIADGVAKEFGHEYSWPADTIRAEITKGAE